MSKIVHYPHIEVAGEDALIVYFDQVASSATIEHIALLKNNLARVLADCVVELVPSYASLLIIFDPLKTDYFAMHKIITPLLSATSAKPKTSQKTIELGVYYSEKSGPDLKALAVRAGLSIEEVINIHQQKTYRVYAIGFAPGFAFLGDVDERIACPRLQTPRTSVAKGSVGIADRQTAIYPNASPGGWNLIGLCPHPLFIPSASSQLTFQVGDCVKFSAITESEFLAQGGQL